MMKIMGNIQYEKQLKNREAKGCSVKAFCLPPVHSDAQAWLIRSCESMCCLSLTSISYVGHCNGLSCMY